MDRKVVVTGGLIVFSVYAGEYCQLHKESFCLPVNRVNATQDLPEKSVTTTYTESNPVAYNGSASVPGVTTSTTTI